MHRSLLLIGLVLALGCAPSAYERAQKVNTPEAYRAYLREHPRDHDAEEAWARLAELEFQKASHVHTLLAYKRFLEEFPDSAPASAARKRLEALRFNVALADGSVDAWRTFLLEHPAEAHADEARAHLAQAEHDSLPKVDSDEELRLRLKEHADDSERLVLQSKLDDRAFAATGQSSFKLLAYLQDFPAGAHREEGQRRLFSLEIDGLIRSGLLDEAARQLARSPFGKLPELDAALNQARTERKLLSTAADALAPFYARDFADLKSALADADPLDRWLAAEELSQHVRVDSVAVLLKAFREARNWLIQERAFQSLATVLEALPPDVREHELATQLQAAKAIAAGPETFLVQAILEDLSGKATEAAADYQRAFHPDGPDPFILWRWSHVRFDRGEIFSGAVAARQLSVWARGQDEELGAPTASVGTARELCAAAFAAEEALALVQAAREKKTDFPEDLEVFEAEATETSKLTAAHLADAELALRKAEPGARRCGEDPVSERISAGIQTRRRMLPTLGRRLRPAAAAAVLRALRERDPSPQVRAEAAALVKEAGGRAVGATYHTSSGGP